MPDEKNPEAVLRQVNARVRPEIHTYLKSAATYTGESIGTIIDEATRLYVQKRCKEDSRFRERIKFDQANPPRG